MSCSACHAPAGAGGSVRHLEAAEAALNSRIAELRPLVVETEALQAINALEKGANDWLKYNREYLSLADGNRFEDAHAILRDNLFPILEQVETSAGVLARKGRESLAEANESVRNGRFPQAGGRRLG